MFATLDRIFISISLINRLPPTGSTVEPLYNSNRFTSVLFASLFLLDYLIKMNKIRLRYTALLFNNGQRLAGINQLRLLSSSSAVNQQNSESAAENSPAVKVPAYVPRGPTDILRALSQTVGVDHTAAHFKYHDDPYLIPTSNSNKRIFALASESGRKAAKWIKQEHADLFQVHLTYKLSSIHHLVTNPLLLPALSRRTSNQGLPGGHHPHRTDRGHRDAPPEPNPPARGHRLHHRPAAAREEQHRGICRDKATTPRTNLLLQRRQHHVRGVDRGALVPPEHDRP